MRELRILFKFTFLITLLSSCGVPQIFQDNSESQNTNIKETKEIKISCGQGSIDDFLADGWIIKKEYSEEKVCSWKTEKANKKCDIDKDKGCLIRKPDIIGETTIYLLEKTIK